jgi:hypothetical protein
MGIVDTGDVRLADRRDISEALGVVDLDPLIAATDGQDMIVGGVDADPLGWFR